MPSSFLHNCEWTTSRRARPMSRALRDVAVQLQRLFEFFNVCGYGLVEVPDGRVLHVILVLAARATHPPLEYDPGDVAAGAGIDLLNALHVSLLRAWRVEVGSGRL